MDKSGQYIVADVDNLPHMAFGGPFSDECVSEPKQVTSGGEGATIGLKIEEVFYSLVRTNTTVIRHDIKDNPQANG